MKRRLFSLLLTGAMLLSMCPPAAAAGPDGMTGGLCPHHQEHSYEVCGYVETVEGQPCGHVHDGDCGYVEAVPEVPCNMGCAETGEDGQIIHAEGCAYTPTVEGVPCQHEHDGECGYVEAIEGQPCGYVCPVCPVQAMIDALPDAEDITADNRAEVEAQLEAIDTARAELTDDEAGQLDPARYQVVVSALAALGGQAGNDLPAPLAGETGDFTVTGGMLNTDYSYENSTLTIKTSTALKISGTGSPTTDKIVIEDGITANVTLNNVNINSSGCAFNVVGDSVCMLTLEETNKLTSGGFAAVAGLQVQSKNGQTASLIITKQSTGSLEVKGDYQGAGIGGGKEGAGGNITINGGTVNARGGGRAAGIGGGDEGAGGNITINGGTVNATGGGSGAGIGGGINSAGGGTFDTGIDGNAFITVDPNISDKNNQDSWQGMIFEGNSGQVYGGSVILTTDVEIPSSKTLTIPENSTLTIGSGVTLTNNGTIQNNGTINVESGGQLVGNVTGSGTVNLPPPAEQFPALTPGGTYWFNLSGAGIPGTKNSSLPDGSLHWVPFTYAGTINAYKLTSAQVTTEEYANQNKYDHSLFIADYNVTHSVSWNDLNGESMIFGKTYTNRGVSYTMRTPSAGSDSTGSGDNRRGIPQNNEWDVILNNADEYIKNWSNFRSWGQDTNSNFTSNRAVRGWVSARFWLSRNAAHRNVNVGFRPVLEIPAPDTPPSDSLKVVTLNLNGGKIGSETGPVNIVVKPGEGFATPSGEGLTAPDGKVFGGWTNNGTTYAVGTTVPTGVSELTAVWTVEEQFPALTPGGTYWFNLSGAGIPGTKNSSLPDGSLHWVPFTYAGTINAYKLTSAQVTTEEYANQNKYDHSLFIADYNVTHSVSWNDLNDQNMIFGKTYTSGDVSYTMRTPSAGSNSIGSNDGMRGTPQNNEWDVILNNADEYIKNWSNFRSWGQDTNSSLASSRAVRSWVSARFWLSRNAALRYVYVGFRPVLELPPPDTPPSDSLKVVTLNLNGGKIGSETGSVSIVVKSGEGFATPSGEGLTAPDGKVFGGWKSGDTVYQAGSTVPNTVTSLTAYWLIKPSITAQPENKTVSVGETATFTVTANGEPAPTYQWQVSKDNGNSWEDISGATGGSYTTEAATMSMNGWQYRCVVTNSGGSATSSAATLTVNKLTPTPTTPTGLTATYGQTLADVSLPTGWAWDAPTTSVGNVGNNSFPATYTQDSSGNYNEVKQNLTVTVSAAPRSITVTGQADSPTQITLDDAAITPSGTGGTVSYGMNTTDTAPTDWQTNKVFSGMTADTTYYFFAKVEANGNYAAAISTGAQIATPAKAVSSIAIASQPSNLTYTSGQTLDLSGLSVTVSYDDGTSETVEWASGKLTASPAAGTVLTVTGHNGQTVTISYGGKTADTSTLTVTQGTQAALSITGAPATIYNGDSFTLTVSGGSGTGAVTWEIISGPAMVDTNGKVTATGTGEIQIKAVKAADTDYTQAEATITLNAVARPTPPPTKYLVSVSGGIGGGEYAEGDTVTITATVPSGQRFTGWTVNEGGVTLADASSATTTFTMPAQNVTVTANFQSNSSGGSSSGGGGGSYTPPTYPPTVERPSEGGGAAAVSPSNPKPGDTVTVKPKPDGGYEVDKITVTDKNGKPVEVTVKPDGTYTFKQPNGKVKIEVTYKAVEKPWNNPFSDVFEGDWYYEAVRFVHERDLMNGYSDGRFGPNDPLSRAQLAQILFNKEGKPVVNYLLDFSDVANEAWYTEAVRWATSQGIVGGYGNGKFGPNDPITREQLAVMLWRYSGSPAATNKELHFNNESEISGFALEALRWAVESGILNGYGDGRLGPQGQATRAQVAQMLKNFIENRDDNI